MSSTQVKPVSSGLNTPAQPKTKKVTSAMQGRAIQHLDRMEWAIRVFAVISIILLVITIILIGLSQARYIQPMPALYAFSASIGCFFIIKAIDCCQQSVAKKHNLDLQEDYYAVKQPKVKKKENLKKSEKKDKKPDSNAKKP